MHSQDLRAILFDMDGVLYNAEQPIDGAVSTLRWVREHAISHLFVTNTSSRGRAALVEKLAQFGMDATADQILNPGVTAAKWIRSQPSGKVALFVRPAARADFSGLDLLPDSAETGASYVVIGDLGQAWDYGTLNRAFRLLVHNPEARLIALGMTRYWQTPDGLALDVAPFVVALQHAAGRQAVVLGKPAAAFFLAAAERLALPPGSAVMVGDDLHTDIAGAQAAGLKALLVKTGKFRPADLECEVTPDAILDSVADLPAWWGR